MQKSEGLHLNLKSTVEEEKQIVPQIPASADSFGDSCSSSEDDSDFDDSDDGGSFMNSNV